MRKPTICIYAKTKMQISFTETVKLISAFVFATHIVHFLLFLNPKFQASSSFLRLYRSVCVGPVRKPHCWFSHDAAQITIVSHLLLKNAEVSTGPSYHMIIYMLNSFEHVKVK